MSYRQEYDGHNLIFIVGSPRSGTTYLQKLLSCHGRIHTGQESDVFDLYIGPLLRTWQRELEHSTDGRGGVGLACYLTEDEFISITRDYLLKLMFPIFNQLNEGDIFIEKTPSHALFIKEILDLFPKARIIHMLRDPRDVVASLLAANRSWGKAWAPGTSVGAYRMWEKHVKAVESCKAYIPDQQFQEIRYERLCEQPRDILQKLSEFLSIEWTDAVIQQAINCNSISDGKAAQDKQIKVGGEFSRRGKQFVKEPPGFARKGTPGSWQSDLNWRQKIRIWILGHRYMSAIGYNWSFPWSRL